MPKEAKPLILICEDEKEIAEMERIFREIQDVSPNAAEEAGERSEAPISGAFVKDKAFSEEFLNAASQAVPMKDSGTKGTPRGSRSSKTYQSKSDAPTMETRQSSVPIMETRQPGAPTTGNLVELWAFSSYHKK